MLRIVTRNSLLALAQVDWVKTQLNNFFPGLTFEVIELVTEGDKFLAAPLYKIGGKSLFVKELDDALLNNEADIAIHSAKDIPQAIPDGLSLACIGERENPFDAWICPGGFDLMGLPSGAVVGTSSLRRMVQLKKIRNDLVYSSIRGNVPTRLKKCTQGDFDAIVLAQAGLIRLNLQHMVTEIFTPDVMLPAVGQGAIGIVVRSGDKETQNLLAPINHWPSYYCVHAERAMNHQLNGSCQVPVAGYSVLEQGMLTLTGRVGHPEQSVLLSSSLRAPVEKFDMLGKKVAQALIDQGAADLIADLRK